MALLQGFEFLPKAVGASGESVSPDSPEIIFSLRSPCLERVVPWAGRVGGELIFEYI